MEIRKSTEADIPAMQKVFAAAREFMAATGNPNQWTDGYPSVEQLITDISRGESYVCLNGNAIIGTFVLRQEKDPTYNTIFDGAWPNDNPYATIHRIAGSGTEKGIFNAAMTLALRYYDTIRIDTHRDNSVMRHILQRTGFRYCGIIHCWNGDERLAYQYDRTDKQ